MAFQEPVPHSSASDRDIERPIQEKEDLVVDDKDIQRLGRERPPTFATPLAEVGFVFAVVMSQILTEYFVSGFNLILPTITRDLHISQATSVWPATVFSLTIASTLLLFGRLGDQHGGYAVYIGGLAWLLVWSIITGFSVNPNMIIICRALQGLGPAAFLPTAVMLIGSAYRPGPRKNLIFAIYGGAAVFGFFTGILFAGIAGQWTNWGWYFWVGAILAGITLIASIYFIPNDRSERRNNKIESDWLGAFFIIAGIVLLVFSITESARPGVSWKNTPYIPTLFSVSIVFIAIAVYVEGWYATRPLLPADIFQVPAMTPLTLAMLFQYGTLGIFILYGTEYFQDFMSATPLQVVAWYVPHVLVGIGLAIGEGLLLHLIPGRILLIIGGIGSLAAQLLLALIPIGGNYWAYILPAMILATIGIDLAITLMMVFVTTNIRRARQGLAGGLVNSVLQLGMALFIGLTDVLRSHTREQSGEVGSFKNIFWFGVAAGGASLILLGVFGNIPKAESDLTADEKEELTELARKESRASMANEARP